MQTMVDDVVFKDKSRESLVIRGYWWREEGRQFIKWEWLEHGNHGDFKESLMLRADEIFSISTTVE